VSQWANENPERMTEIAALPMNEQSAALRDAIGYDPDAIRERAEERIHHHRDLSKSSGPPSSPENAGPRSPGTTSRSANPSSEGGASVGPSYADGHCDVCGAPVGKHHLSYCDLRGDV
jgi:hypothetical protein